LIVVCGETLIDLVHVDGELWRALPGGGPANVAVALARLGSPTAMLARISGDAFGGRLRERLADNGVDLRYVVPAAEPSTVAVVDLDESGGARYSFYLRETADWQWSDSSLPAGFDDAVTALHAGSMALFMPPGGVALEAMLSRERVHRVISIDPNVRAAICPDPLRYREIVERWLTVAHVVKASADDVGWLYPDRPLTDVLLDWSQRGPSVVAITLGADGVVARTAAGELVQSPGVPVDVVDTIGAGDTFSAAFLHALGALKCLEIEKLAALPAAQLEVALRYAVRASGVTCTRAGADPPYGQDLPPVLALPAE
jgi:fructokinase